MKTQEELNALKTEYETLNNKLKELTEDELKMVIGGEGPNYKSAPIPPDPHQHTSLEPLPYRYNKPKYRCTECGYFDDDIELLRKHCDENHLSNYNLIEMWTNYF